MTLHTDETSAGASFDVHEDGYLLMKVSNDYAVLEKNQGPGYYSSKRGI
jgi:hypothetical protein